jgi:hypothetical protein
MNLTQELQALLQQEGCTLYGIADITALPEKARKKLPVGIALGCAMHCGGVEKTEAGTTKLTGVHGGNTFEPLDKFTQAVVNFLTERKFKAVTQGFTMAVVTDKTVATLGGLGWIGNCALLTTRQVGPALRLGVILTNAPLECNEPVTESHCPPECTACRDICPTQAISGKRWARGIHRDEFFNVEACKKGRKKQGGLCWLCIEACPLAVAGLRA